ncbi:MAG: hypothetical protein Q9174_004521, partial [Haloplaca sp. 1 TL-2023]
MIQRKKKSPTPSKADSLALLSHATCPAFDVFDSPLEKRSFDFFTANTARDLAGYFPSEFLEKLVPLATFHQPSLKHAAIALASLHERFQEGDQSILRSNADIVEGGFALQQYNLAIQHLIKGAKAPTLDTSLVACVLFACFESLRGHHGSALSHIRSGVRILTQLYEQQGDSSNGHSISALCVSRESLDVVFARLNNQEVQLLGTRPMELPPARENSQPGFGSEIPTEFKSLEEARNSLDYHWNITLRGAVDFARNSQVKDADELQDHRNAYFNERVHLQASFNQWSAAFQAFLDVNVHTMDSKALRGAMLLQLSKRLGTMHLEAGVCKTEHEETCWDDKHAVYEEIVDVATSIVDSQRDEDQRSGQKPVFQLDQSIVGPLFGVAHKCRDPTLRRRVIALLRSKHRQEGVWDSILTARVAERIMKLEEEGLGE